MGQIADKANEVYRDFVTDGVPGSGENKPDKAGIRELNTLIDQQVAGAAEGLYVRATWAALELITPDQEAARGEVTNDAGTHPDPVVGGTVNNEGTYSWHSGSGGGWERVGELSAHVIASQAATAARSSNTEVVSPFGLDAALDPMDTERQSLAEGIRDVARITGWGSNPVKMKIAEFDLLPANRYGNPASITITCTRTPSGNVLWRTRTGVVTSGTTFTHTAATFQHVEVFDDGATTPRYQFSVDEPALVRHALLLQKTTTTAISSSMLSTKLRDLVTRTTISLTISDSEINDDLGMFGLCSSLEVLSANNCGFFGNVKVFQGRSVLRRVLVQDNPLIEGDIVSAIKTASAFERLNVAGCPLLTGDLGDLPASTAFTQLSLNECTLLDFSGLATAIAGLRLNNVGLVDCNIDTPTLDAIVIAIRTVADANAINGGTLNMIGCQGLSRLGDIARDALIASPRLWTVTGPEPPGGWPHS